MKRSVAFAVLAGAMILNGAASAAEVRFRGAFTITSITNCLARYVGETFNSAFRPASIGSNPAITSLTQLNQYSGDVYELNGPITGLNKWITLSGNGFDNLHYSFVGAIWLTTMSPAVITTTTNQLDLEGYLWNMGNDPGVGGNKCVAGFRGAYFRRVE